MSLVRVARKLARETGALRFGPPVAHVYNPLEYAFRPHEQYLRRFGQPGCEALLLGSTRIVRERMSGRCR